MKSQIAPATNKAEALRLVTRTKDLNEAVISSTTLLRWIDDIKHDDGTFAFLNGTFEGMIDLSGVDCRPVITFRSITFTDPFIWRNAHLSALQLIDQCVLSAGLDISGSVLSAELDCTSSTICGQLRVSQVAADYIVLNDCSICVAAGGPALAGAGLITRRGFYLRGSNVVGGIALNNASIGGNAEIITSSVVGMPTATDDRMALALDNTSVGGSLLIRTDRLKPRVEPYREPKAGVGAEYSRRSTRPERCVLEGQLRMVHTHVAKQTDFSNLVVSNQNPMNPAIFGKRFRCDGSVLLGKDSRVVGGLCFDYANVDSLTIGQVVVEPPQSLHSTGDASTFSAKHMVCRILDWHMDETRVRGVVDMSWCHVGTLEVDWGGPDRLQHEVVSWVIDGLNYESVNLQFVRHESTSSSAGNRGRNSAERMLRWLDSAKFNPYSYARLARECRRHGFDDMEKQVNIAMESRRVKESLEAIAPLSKSRYRARQVKYSILRRVVGYGYAPERSIAWIAALIAIGTGVFALGISDGALRSSMSPSVAPTLIRSIPRGLVYSIDTAMPLIDLGMVSSWHLSDQPSHTVSVLWIYSKFHIALGWALSLFFAATITGVIKKGARDAS